MLGLTRRTLESVFLETSDGEVEIIIKQITNDKVHLLFNAPIEIGIVREELSTNKSIASEMRREAFAELRAKMKEAARPNQRKFAR